jgi:hypothetical protein
MPGSRLSWEDFFTNLGGSMRRKEWQTREEVARWVKVASAGLGNSTELWKSDNGRF